MATRSTIALEFADGTVQQVYCHWDGYLDHNGNILRDHYSDPFKLQRLIDLGDLSTLCPEVDAGNDSHSFSAPKPGVCIFYGRDRGETGCEARTFKDFQEYTREATFEEYDYILRQVNGKAQWFVQFYGTDGEYLTLEEAFEYNKEEA